MNKEFIILDIETTGVVSKRDDIIEFAGVRINASGQILAELDLLIHTDKELTPVIRAITGITPDNLVGQPTFDAVKDQIVEFIGDAPIVGHNIGFDIEFLNAKGCGLKNPALDTLELAYTVLPAQDYYSLEYLAHTYDFLHKPSHRAMNDVLATLDLMKLLVTRAQATGTDTKTQIAQLVPSESWSWGWVFESTLKFEFTGEAQSDELFATKLSDAVQTGLTHLPAVQSACQGGINFIEADFDLDAVAQTLAYASTMQPAVVVVPVWMFYKTNWHAASTKVGFAIQPYYSPTEIYEPDAEIKLCQDKADLTSTEAKLVTKITIWKNEWNQDLQKLFLTRDEKFQWEQKIAPVETDKVAAPTPQGVLVTTAENLFTISNLDKWAIVASTPTLLEDAAFISQTKTLSLNYCSALVSSRRDFVHRYVVSHDVRLSDDLFKLLNVVSGKLTDLSQFFIDIFKSNPPESVYDKNIELQPELVNDELVPFLEPITTALGEYITKLENFTASPAIAKQIQSTRALKNYLEHLQRLSGQYRYFLFADATRFFLDIVPTQPSFKTLQDMVQQALSFTVISPALTFAGNFDYFKPIFGDFHAAVIERDKTDLILAQDRDPNLVPEKWLPSLVEKFSLGQDKTLVIASTAFESQHLLIDLFNGACKNHTTLESFDTVGNLSRLPDIMRDKPSFILLGHYMWLERGKWYATEFDRIVFSKMPFDPLSKAQFRILGDGRDGFSSYTLPRATMKLKMALHQGRLLNIPMVLVDGRLLLKDYGRDVLKSLTTFNVIPEEISGIDV
ncbi:MAG: exonuclease domain-containing protein [Patescibacteria group bacterium]|nr:exonuclease domain-containing protein [Patescibacteria group bacterium]